MSDTVDPGVDVEAAMRAIDPLLADTVLTVSERAWLAGLAAEAQPLGFSRLWTLKEAFVKATGQGLSQQLQSFAVDPDRLDIGFAPAFGQAARLWHFGQWLSAAGFVVAAAWRMPQMAAPVRGASLTWLTPAFLE